MPVGPHLADQLMLPLAISARGGAGGAFRTMTLSRHAETHIEVLKRFLPDLHVDVQMQNAGDVIVRIG